MENSIELITTYIPKHDKPYKANCLSAILKDKGTEEEERKQVEKLFNGIK